MPLHTPESAPENLSGSKIFSLIEHGVDVHVVDREIVQCSFIESLRSLFLDISPEQIRETEKTIHYLYTKFHPIYSVLNQKFGVSEKDFLSALTKRLVARIQESNVNPTRKFFNKDVTSLKQMTTGDNGGIHMELENIPYWAFACTGVSLDEIQIQTRHGNKTLRCIVDAISEDGKNSAGEYILPNSLGVSVMIQLHDGTIIGQVCNNNAVTTKYYGLKASASGAIDRLSLGKHGIEKLKHGAKTEMLEELGLTTESISHVPDISNMAVSMQSHILRELGISNTHFSALVPLGVVVEAKRNNPEVIFTLVLPPSVRFSDIEKSWKKAKDKTESLSLVAVTPNELEQQLEYYNQHVPPELRNSPTGLEQFIAQNPECRNWIGPHFLMSYTAWQKAYEEKIKKFREGTLRLLESSDIPEHRMDTYEFPGSSEKPTEDADVHHGGWYGVFDGATGLAPLTTTKDTGGRIAARTAAEVVKNTSGDALTVLEAANTAITREMDKAGVDTSNPLHRFMTSASLVRKTPHGIEYASVADSTIIVQYADGSIQVITEQVDHDEQALRLWSELVEELGPKATYKDVRYHPRMIQALEEGRKQANKGPYAVLRGDYAPASGIQKGFIPWDKNGGIKRVVLFTDGCEIPTETPWNKDEAYYRHMLDILKKGGTKALAAEVQRVAESDPQCLRYPRFKKLDDGTIIDLDFYDNKKGKPISRTSRLNIANRHAA